MKLLPLIAGARRRKNAGSKNYNFPDFKQTENPVTGKACPNRFFILNIILT
jgi:hypothetical protein